MRKLLFAIMVYVFSRVERMRVRFRALARLLRGRQRALVCLLFLAAGPSLYAQKYVTVCGFLEDRATGERLANATLYEMRTGRGTVCNEFGFYSLTLPPGDYTFRADYVGYLSAFLSMHLRADTACDIALERAGWLEEVIVRGKRPFVAGTQMGKHEFSAARIKAMPAILGESDLMRALAALPGVNSGVEGKSGISVRGGSPEQTAILLDGMPVYNVNHLFGYLSAFNGEALQAMTLYKGAIPARYGGRLSSVLDVSMREGNMKRLAGNFSLSPLAATLTVEGPLKKDEASFLVSGRYSWLNALMQGAYKIVDGGDVSSGVTFYDLNAKFNWICSSRDRLYFSFYNGWDMRIDKFFGGDKPDKNRNSWGNIGASLRWNRVVDSRLFTNAQLYYTRFRRTDLQKDYDDYRKAYEERKTYTDLQELTLSSAWEFMPTTAHTLRFGGVFSGQWFRPEMSYFRVMGNDTHFRDTTRGAVWSVCLYAEDDWQLAPRWRANAGIRASAHYTPHRSYYDLEPRLELTFLVNDRNSLKASWSRMSQPLHLLTTVSLGAPSELWVPVTDKVRPGRSDLYSIGYYRQVKDIWEFSVEAYYNDLRRVIRYRDDVAYVKQKDVSWQDYLHTGRGRGYGVEVMLNKTAGALNGWIAYTWSKSERSFDGIRDGIWFPFEYDRRHKLNVSTTYTFREVKEQKFLKMLAVNFTYASGNYTTVGLQYYPAAPLPYKAGDDVLGSWSGWEYIPHPNNVQLPAYHHLDVAFHLKNKKPKGDSWTFGIYNLYGRKNPSYYYRTGEGGETVIKRLSICLFVPCVTWSYTF